MPHSLYERSEEEKHFLPTLGIGAQANSSRSRYIQQPITKDFTAQLRDDTYRVREARAADPYVLQLLSDSDPQLYTMHNKQRIIR